MSDRLRRIARWLGALLLAWGTPRDAAPPYDFVSLTPLQADALLALFSVPSRPGRCPTCDVSWDEHHCPYVVSAGPSERRCETCDVPLPVDAVRTHDGLWRCRAHK